MATVPLSGTNIRLLSGVPFSNDYKNTRWFDDVTSQTNYFLSKPVIHSIGQNNFQRIEGHSFLSVSKSIDELWSTHYLMFQNSSYNGKWFYAFVTKLEYIQKHTTYVHFQIDVFQTWKFEMNMKPSFVVREHCKLWNDDGSPVVNTVDEGLHYGSEYKTVKVDHYIPYDNVYFLVIVSKNTMHGGSANPPVITPTVNGSPQPLTYYVHPFKLDGSSPSVTMDGMALGIDDITDVLKQLYTQTDAVNNIVSLYVTEYFGYNATYSGGNLTVSSDVLEHVTIQDDNGTFNTLYLKTLPAYNTLLKDMGSKYIGYATPVESKLLMYPYTVLILDDLKGNRIELKNEYINDPNIVINTKGSLGTSNKVSYNVRDYLMDSDTLSYSNQLSLEKSLINNNPNDVAIITDLLAAYLQGNRNSLENQRASILFNANMSNASHFISGATNALSRNAGGTLNNVTGIIQGTGNALLQIQGLEAKQQDINNIPPQLTKMGSNTSFDYGNGINGLYIIKKQITYEYTVKLTQFFNMFGYKLNQVKIPNFHTRQNWNYIQTANCTILGNFNNEDLQELKSIFDGGITLWHTDDVGNYLLENGVI